MSLRTAKRHSCDLIFAQLERYLIVTSFSTNPE
jgi:hypothetical protein